MNNKNTFRILMGFTLMVIGVLMPAMGYELGYESISAIIPAFGLVVAGLTLTLVGVFA